MSFALNIAACHRCLASRKATCSGVCVCPVGGGDVIDRAESGQCPIREFDKPAPVRAVIHGAAGIAKALTGTGGADEATVKARTEICRTCENAILTAGVLERCKLCGCSTWAKVRVASESCPARKWGASESRATEPAAPEPRP